MAATRDKSPALLALTSAALGLPGMDTHAATAATQATGSVQYGYYQESDDRMKVEVYHGDFTLPITDRLEFSFSVDRDTYSGATPAFSLPETMTNQVRFVQGGKGNTERRDVISAASPVASAGFLTTLGGLDTFKQYNDAVRKRAAANDDLNAKAKQALTEQYQAALANLAASRDAGLSPIDSAYQAQQTTILNNYTDALGQINAQIPGKERERQSAINSRLLQKNSDISTYPDRFPQAPTAITSGTTIGFEDMARAVYGWSNLPLNPNGTCQTANNGCYSEKGFIVGVPHDPGDVLAHLHRITLGTNQSLQYHADSSGIYLRAENGQPFGLTSLLFKAPISQSNPGTGPNDQWEILGFNSAVNQSLTQGDGTNYPTRIAYQTVANGLNGNLALDPGFGNVNAVWIHYKGWPRSPTPSGTDTTWDALIDNVNLGPSTNYINWIAERDNYVQQADAKYQQDINAINASYDQQIAALAASDPDAKRRLDEERDAKLKQAEADRQAQFASLEAAHQAQITALNQQIAKNERAIAKEFARREKAYTIRAYRQLLNQPIPKGARTVQRFQYQPMETRTMPIFNLRYYLDDSATLGLSGGQSNEPDYHSSFGSLNFSQELNNKLTTLSAAYSYTHNEVSRNSASHASHHASDPRHNPTTYPTLDANNDFHGFNLGLTQVMDKNTLLRLSANYTRQTGYLSNPYKSVYVRGEITPEEYYDIQTAPAGKLDWNSITKLEVQGIDLFREVRPDERNLFSLSTGFNRFIPELNAAAHFDYRFYVDDWGIDSHTFELKWFQTLPWGVTVTPTLRYYSQSGADFFAPYFLAPRADGHYSSDYRLSAYGALSGGVAVTKQITKGISLNLGVEYYTHQGDLKLGGGGESNYADFSYWLTHAGLKIDLSAPGMGFDVDDGGHHHHHHQHGAAPPPGLMFAHMMGQSNDVMVGYRYLYTNQTGAIQRGSNPVSEPKVRAAGCGSVRCEARPTDMSMQMHMLELMYAPTDWLNVMVMPQLMDMSMNLTQLPGASEESTHGGKHSSHGLGDTLMSALVKLFDVDGHRAHLGLTFSAPSGDVDLTLDGRKEATSELQDYGMQLGSGTWDFRPSLTYTGQASDLFWGAQINGIQRLTDRNKTGYVLGDQLQLTAWGGYAFTDWMSASLRGIYTNQGKIRGAFNRPHPESATVDFTQNYGGEFWDIGIGFNLSVPSGAFAGHTLGVEWQQPVATHFNGYQLEREGTLAATWTYSF